MKRYNIIFFVTLYLFSIKLFAQKKSQLYGSWKSYEEKLIVCNCGCEEECITAPFILTIGKKYSYISHQCIFDSGSNVNQYEQNKIHIRRHNLIIKNRLYIDSLSIIEGVNDFKFDTKKIKYKLESDSNLVLVQKMKDTNCLYQIRLKKIEPIAYKSMAELRKQFAVERKLFSQQKVITDKDNALRQKLFLQQNALTDKINKHRTDSILKSKAINRFELINSALKLKRFTLTMNCAFVLYINENNYINGAPEKIEYYCDAIDTIGKDSVIKFNYYLKKHTFFDGEKYLEDQKNEPQFNINSKFSTIKISSIDHLQFQSARRNYISFAFFSGFACSIVSTILVAPLVSIDYNNSSFNKNKYFKVAGFSLLSAVICFTLSSKLSEGKIYHINKKYGKNSWQFVIGKT